MEPQRTFVLRNKKNNYLKLRKLIDFHHIIWEIRNPWLFNCLTI